LFAELDQSGKRLSEALHALGGLTQKLQPLLQGMRLLEKDEETWDPRGNSS
jgi:hypothetical protein